MMDEVADGRIGIKGQLARDHLVEHNAQRIEIGTPINLIANFA